MTEVVVVGGGVAGLAAALAASKRGAETTLVESSGRVGFSKALLPLLMSGGLAKEDLFLSEADSLGKAGVTVRTGETVTSVSHAERRISVRPSHDADLEDRDTARSIRYDSAVICTGATAQLPQLRGISKTNVFLLKETADYLRLSSAVDLLTDVAVSGPIPLALKIGEILATKGKQVEVYCGTEGLERQFSRPVADAIRRAASARVARLTLVDGPLDSVLGIDKAEAITSRGSVRTCDSVVLIPRSAPSFPLIDCQKGSNGGLLVDPSMRTSSPDVFAAGDSAEVKFKSGSVPARLFSTSRVCGEVAGDNAAGGRASASPSWAVEQTYFGLEFCSAGLSEDEASTMGLDAATEAGGSTGRRTDDEHETLVSMVYDRATHQVYGLQIVGWRASSLSNAASMVISMGLTVEQLRHIESPYAPGVTPESSPIALTAGKILDREGI